MPDRGGENAEERGSKGGNAIVARMNPVHARDSCSGSVHPIANASTQAGGDKVLLKLSSIFHKLPSGIAD